MNQQDPANEVEGSDANQSSGQGGSGRPKSKALGKGLDALLGLYPAPSKPNQAVGSANPLDGRYLMVNTSQIDPNPQQPRQYFQDQELSELADSIKANGILQPIIVAHSEKAGRFTIIAGERRLRASILAKIQEVPVIVKDTSTEDLLRLALLENIQRADLNIIEEARAFENLINQYGLTQEQCAIKLGKERTSVSNTLRLLHLPASIQDDLIQGRLSPGHGKALVALGEEALTLKARNLVLKNSLSVRQTEKLCKKLKGPAKEQGEKDPKNSNLDYLADHLREHLRTKIRFVGSGQRGKIEVSYFSASELERILELIGLSLS